MAISAGRCGVITHYRVDSEAFRKARERMAIKLSQAAFEKIQGIDMHEIAKGLGIDGGISLTRSPQGIVTAEVTHRGMSASQRISALSFDDSQRPASIIVDAIFNLLERCKLLLNAAAGYDRAEVLIRLAARL